MTTSPWATPISEQSPSSNPEKIHDKDEPIIDVSIIDKLAVWCDSEITKQLFEMLEKSPEIGIQNILHSSSLLRRTNDTILKMIDQFAQTPNIQEGFFDGLNIALSGYDDDPSIHDNLNSETSRIMAETVDKLYDNQCILCLKLYSALTRHASHVVTNEYFDGKLLPLTLSGIADDVDDIINLSEETGDTDFALSPLELIHYDNLIQDGYRKLRVFLSDSLRQCDIYAKNIKFNASIVSRTDDVSKEFQNAVLTIKSYHDTLKELYDDLDDTVATNRWATFYELYAETVFEDCVKNKTPLADITLNDGVTVFLKDFIDYNSDLSVEPEDAFAFLSAIKLVNDHFQSPQNPKENIP